MASTSAVADEQELKLQKLIKFGFSRANAAKALNDTSGDVHAAMARIADY